MGWVESEKREKEIRVSVFIQKMDRAALGTGWLT